MDKLAIKSTFFRSIPVHFGVFFLYLRAVIPIDTGTSMAGTVKKMSLIKQVLQLKQQGESNCGADSAEAVPS